MNDTYASTGDRRGAERYEIRIQGHLAPRWAAWFDGLSLTQESDGTTVIRGSVIDQAALHGLLSKVRDLGLPLIAVTQVDPKTNERERKMKITASNLLRWAGSSAVLAGSSFVVVGLLHPPQILSSVTTGTWLFVHLLTIAVSFFGLLGIAGLYAGQAEEVGWLGLAGFALFSLWLVLVPGFTFFEALILPLLASDAPKFAGDFLATFTGAAVETKLGILPMLWSLLGVLYILGPLLFGVATLRAGILSRWAAGTFGFGAVSSVAFGLLPSAIEPLATVPMGLGLAWLGYSLWSERREPGSQRVPASERAQLRPTPAA